MKKKRFSSVPILNQEKYNYLLTIIIIIIIIIIWLYNHHFVLLLTQGALRCHHTDRYIGWYPAKHLRSDPTCS